MIIFLPGINCTKKLAIAEFDPYFIFWQKFREIIDYNALVKLKQTVNQFHEIFSTLLTDFMNFRKKLHYRAKPNEFQLFDYRKRSRRVLYLLPQSKSSLLYSLITIIAILKWRREGVPRPIKLNSVPSKCETPHYKDLDALAIHF